MPFPYTPQTWIDGVSSASAARLAVIEAGIALAGVYGTSTTPPGSPVDGMIWRYPADSANGVYWFFQYDSAQTTYKWIFVGGAALFAEVSTQQSTASTTYAVLATAGPSITVPRAGDYLVEIGMRVENATAATGLMSYDIGATAAIDGDAVSHATVNLVAPSGSRLRKKTVLAASTALVSKYRTTAGTASFVNRWMRIVPVRVI